MFGWLRRAPSRRAEQQREMASALADYPIYDPPHRQDRNWQRRPVGESYDEEDLRLMREFNARGRENFSYFMNHRDERLTALGTFLAKLGVIMDLDETGLASVSAWLPGNCGALVADPREEETRQVFFQHLEPWTQQRRGLNVIFDLGVFFGECVIKRNQRLHWTCWPGASAIHTGHAIAGFKKKRHWLDPMGNIYYDCVNDENAIRRRQVGVVRADTLVGKVRDYSTR